MRTTSFDDWVLVLALAALGVAMLGTALSRDIVAPELALSVLVFAAGTGVFWQAWIVVTVVCLRQRPSCTTSGMLFPTGTLFSVNFPSKPVVTLTRGDPDAAAPQVSHETPVGNGCTAAFGTYTTALGSGSTPLGAYTVPEMLVVPPPGQLTCWRQRFVHEVGTPHWPLVVPPQVSGRLQLPH